MSRSVNSLPKSERLNKKILISKVYESGIAVKAYPLIFSYQLTDKSYFNEPQLLFTVSKRKFKRAVDRNRIKRLMREAYRLKKHDLMLCIPEKQSLFAVVTFTNKELPDFLNIQKSFDKIEKQLKSHFTQDSIIS
ncbi:MAG: ribonuclease P protein component [Bacteroidota bacterium]|nr:ribonuclease P protein component [Bacteroidota bacterium]